MSYQLNGSGLLVPEGAQEAAVAAALRRHDDSLRLVPQASDHFGRTVYKVYRYHGPDQEAEFVCGWWDEQAKTAYPLSHAIVDYVQQLDRSTRGHAPTLEELEAEHRAEQRADYLRDAEALVKDHGPRVDDRRRAPLPRGRSLQLARDKTRREMRGILPEELLP